MATGTLYFSNVTTNNGITWSGLGGITGTYDTGTAVTIEFFTSDGQYGGGLLGDTLGVPTAIDSFVSRFWDSEAAHSNDIMYFEVYNPDTTSWEILETFNSGNTLPTANTEFDYTSEMQTKFAAASDKQAFIDGLEFRWLFDKVGGADDIKISTRGIKLEYTYTPSATEETKDFTVDAYLKDRIEKDFTVDARLVDRSTKDFSVDSSLTVWLIGHWKLDGDATDSSIFENDGSPTDMSYSSGVIDQGGDFNGTTSKIDVGSPAILDDVFSGGGSISFWENALSAGESDGSRLFEKDRWHLRTFSTTVLLWQQYFSISNGTWSFPITAGRYNHIVVVYNNDSLDPPVVYVDGSAVSVSTVFTPEGIASSDVGDSLIIGNEAGQARTFHGQLDDIRVYSKELTEAEVLTLYDAVVSTVTKDFAVDAGLKDRIEKDFAVDAALQTLDNDKEFTVDGYLVNRYTKEFSVDSVLQLTTEKNFTIDAYLVNRLTKDSIIDARLMDRSTKEFTIDAELEAATVETKEFTIDAVLLLQSEKDFAVDARLVDRSVKEFTLDVYLVDRLTKALTSDARLINRGTKDFAVDGVLQATTEKNFTIDAYLVNRLTKDSIIDARLMDRSTKEFTTDARVVDRITKNTTIDAVLVNRLTKDITCDVALMLQSEKDFTVDAQLVNRETKESTIDAALVTVGYKTFTVDTHLVREIDFTIDARLVNRETKTFAIDGILEYSLDHPVWPLPRPIAYDPNDVWDEDTETWNDPTSALGAERLTRENGRQHHYFIVINENGDVYYGEV